MLRTRGSLCLGYCQCLCLRYRLCLCLRIGILVSRVRRTTIIDMGVSLAVYVYKVAIHIVLGHVCSVVGMTRM